MLNEERGTDMIVKLWVDAIINGDKTFSKVPRLLRYGIEEELINSGHEELVN